MSRFFSRRQFIGGISTAAMGGYFGLSKLAAGVPVQERADPSENLFDWSPWEKYRNTVKHPCLSIRNGDLNYALENIQRYDWAKTYAATLDERAKRYLHLITPEFLEWMIEETTPGDPLWTPCPSCRDQGKPVHPHGLWSWKVENPDAITCDMCGAIFPNKEYPEEVILQTRWGKPQTLTYYGGDTFPIFGYKQGRPSFSANIRSRKVQWISSYCRTAAEAYFVTGEIEYARVTKRILLRFADCYPNWLIHVGYGEYADMDPRIAARYMSDLPEPEVCPPPNTPDNKLWTGFWSAGRATGVGLESDFIRKVVLAYDLTCADRNKATSSIYSEDEKLRIERDLLLESTILLVCDKNTNNKSVSNCTAVALVGMCVGHPGLVRFGLDSFNKTIDSWYLDDGTTSETPFYGLMTLGGIWDMAQASRAYSDPPGFLDTKGKRIDSLDLYHDSGFHRVWDAFFRGLQGDLFFPPYADSFRVTTLDTAYVELMVANYPARTEYLALLKALCGENLSRHSGSAINPAEADNETDEGDLLKLPHDLAKPVGYRSFSFYYRQPGLENKTCPQLKLPDWCPPELRIGHLRTGDDGRESLLLMSASHWGIHHELDSLNLYYWKEGSEILSDLGYLWDHPLKSQNIRTLAHNTVLIDEKDQIKQERGGEVLLFKTHPHVKVMEMSSHAYPQAKLYQRTAAIIDHGRGRNYVVDFFRVEGGQTQDYVFHGIDSQYHVDGLPLQPLSEGRLYDFTNVRSGDGSAPWRAMWKSGKINCAAWSPGLPGEQIFVADGWGQRDWKNSDIHATIPYFVRRCRGVGKKTFISVFEGYQTNQSFVRGVRVIDATGIVEVETAIGTDYVMSLQGSGAFEIEGGKNAKKLSGHFAATSRSKNKTIWHYSVPER